MKPLIVGVVIPCFRVGPVVLDLINRIGPEVQHIFLVDDVCPLKTGQMVLEKCKDPRVQVIFNKVNKGVGGAVKAGYFMALKYDCDIIVKMDGDGQMDPIDLPRLIDPILRGQSDYSKGNRFFDFEHLKTMPIHRVLGNAALTFAIKLMTGYWTLFDPTNGYTAIHKIALSKIPLNKMANRYFFESDMLFRLAVAQAVTIDVPIPARYGDEQSYLNIWKVMLEFPPKMIIRFFKRLIYKYIIRDFNLGTLYLFGATLFIGTGATYGIWRLYYNFVHDLTAPSGVVMLAALPLILGFQLLLSFFSYDLFQQPSRPLQVLLRDYKIHLEPKK